MKIKNIKALFFLLIFLIPLYSVPADEQKNNQKIKQEARRVKLAEMRNTDFKQGKIRIVRELSAKAQLKTYLISYQSDGFTNFALWTYPKANRNFKMPVIIVNHGYIHPDKYSTERSYRRVSDLLAAGGFMVLKPDYRGHGKSEGRGNPVLDRQRYVIDVLNLIHALPSLSGADSDNIFLWGHSMGGGISLAVLEVYDNIRAASLWAPVSKPFPESIRYFVARRGKEAAKQLTEEIQRLFNKEEYAELSPINYTQWINAPLIIQHGTDDESVPYSWSQELSQALEKTGRKYQLFTYKADDHNFSRGNFNKVIQRDIKFFKEHIKE